MATEAGGVSISSLLSMLKDYQSTSLTLWNIYIVVVFALLGFVIGKDKPAGHSVRALMTVGFLAFVAGNVTFLERCQRIIYALSAELSKHAEDQFLRSDALRKVLRELPGHQSESILILHFSLDVLVIVALWAAPAVLKKGGTVRETRTS